MNNEYDRLLRAINESQNILIVSHENPDADAIGSTLGLGLALSEIGKRVTMYNRDAVPENLKFLPGSDEILSSLRLADASCDIAIAVDCAEMDRAGEDFVRFAGSGNVLSVAIIDHHKTNKSSVDISVLDEHASSTGMIVYAIIKSLAIGLTEDIAVNLYATISGDTGSFRYSNTNHDTFTAAAELVSAGARPERIAEELYENEPLRKLKLLSLVLTTLHIEDGRIAAVTVDRNMFKKTGTTRQDTEGMVNLPRSVRGVEVAVLFREEGEEGSPRWKVSLRSKGVFDVSKVAEYFGGGGHRNAAGCSVEGDLDRVRDTVIGKIKEVMK